MRKPSSVEYKERENSHVKVVASKIRCLKVCRELFLDRIQTQEEIHRLIEEVFGERKKLSMEEFSQIIEEVSSEMFLAVRFILFNFLSNR